MRKLLPTDMGQNYRVCSTNAKYRPKFPKSQSPVWKAREKEVRKCKTEQKGK